MASHWAPCHRLLQVLEATSEAHRPTTCISSLLTCSPSWNKLQNIHHIMAVGVSSHIPCNECVLRIPFRAALEL